MKKRLLVVAIIILIGIGLIVAASGNIYIWKNLPRSLDQYYETQPPKYLIDMFELGGSMQGIIVNIQQGDMVNSKKSFEVFSQNYENSSRMVPEWRRYYDLRAVKKLGDALDAQNIPAAFEAMGEVGDTCSTCHRENMPPVWNKYNWKDFRAVNISTPEGQLPWGEAKAKYLVIGFDGIDVNIRQNNQSGAQRSFDLFRTMFDNMTEACNSCHLSERKYYVSSDVQAMINDMGENITDGNLNEAGRLFQEIGMKSCYGCHVLHMPAQDAKEEISRK